MSPELNAALSTPRIAVYGDGRVIASRLPVAEEVPLAYRISQVGEGAVAQFAADAEATGVVDADFDFGNPRVADLPVTRITFHGSASEQVVHVNAFSNDFENGVARAQGKARRQLREIIDQAFALPGDTTTPESYQPDQVRVIELSPFDDSRPGPAWPGPDPDTFLTEPGRGYGTFVACGTFRGRPAQTVYAAAPGNPGALWTVAGEKRTLAVVALLPGTDACRF